MLLALALSLLTTVLAVSTKPFAAETNSQFGLAYIPIAGQEASFAHIQAAVTYPVRLPTTLGLYAELKFDKETKGTIIIYASNKPADDANFVDVMKTDAIILFELPNRMNIKDAKQNIIDSINNTKDDVGALQQITVNGFLGCAGGNVWHTVTWYTDTNYYQLTASMKFPLEQLVNIANSIPVK